MELDSLFISTRQTASDKQDGKQNSPRSGRVRLFITIGRD